MTLAVFRADANAVIGGGHIMRCLTLANKLTDFGWTCSFETGNESIETVPALAESGFTVSKDTKGAIADCDLLVVDHYGLDRSYEKTRRPNAKRIMVIDDTASRPHDCDLLLDQTPGRKPMDFSRLVPDDCRLLLGGDFAILRDEFLSQRQNVEPRKKIDSILISFGATDPANATVPAIEGVVRSAIDAEVVVVLTRAMPAFHAARSAAQAAEFSVAVEPDNLAELMCNADVAIGAGGISSWERCCLGLPTLVFALADNQIPNIVALETAGGAINLGVPGDDLPDRVAQALSHLNTEKLRRMSEVSLNFVDGLGVSRVLIALGGEELSRSRRRVSLCAASQNDARLLFEWQSLPGVREFSRNPELPLWSEHKSWFKDKLINPHTLLCLIDVDNQSKGMLRIDRRRDSGYEVSIFIEPDSQKDGIGAAALRLIRRACPGADIWAFVMQENEPSQSLFVKAGYTLAGDGWYLSKGRA